MIGRGDLPLHGPGAQMHQRGLQAQVGGGFDGAMAGSGNLSAHDQGRRFSGPGVAELSARAELA